MFIDNKAAIANTCFRTHVFVGLYYDAVLHLPTEKNTNCEFLGATVIHSVFMPQYYYQLQYYV